MRLAAALPSPQLAIAAVILFVLFVAGEVTVRKLGTRRLLTLTTTAQQRVHASIWTTADSTGQRDTAAAEPRVRVQAKVGFAALVLATAIVVIALLLSVPVTY